MSACIFCKIIKKEIPSQPVYESDEFLAIHDIHPQSKIHILIIPKQHFATLDEAEQRGHLANISQGWLPIALEVARKVGIEASGFRLVINQREEGGQTVFHLHMHLLGGARLTGKFS